MIYRVRMFAGLADLCGGPFVTLELSSDEHRLTAEALKQRLIRLYPHAEAAIVSSFVAKNRAYAEPGEILLPDDELALIPPVSGGEPATDKAANQAWFSLTYEPLSIEKVEALVRDPNHGAGLVFIGTTREWTHGKRTVRLEYEAYEPMAIATMEQIGREIESKCPGTKTAIAHRLGVVEIGEVSVVIAVSSPHRAMAYDASRYAIERLKQIVPIWKKEIWEDGSEWKGHQTGPWNPLNEPSEMP